MSISTAIALIASAYVCIASLYLVIHPAYKAGIVGSIGLALLSVGALGRFSGLVEYCLDGHAICYRERFTPAMLVWVGLATLLAGICWNVRKKLKARGDNVWIDLWRQISKNTKDDE